MKLETVKTNNYGEFLTDTLNLSGNVAKSLRRDQRITKYAFEIFDKIGVEKKDHILDYLVNDCELGTNESLEIYGKSIDIM